MRAGTKDDALNVILSQGEEKVKELLDIDVKRRENGGRELVALCPFCSDSSGHMYISTDEPVYHCFKCEEAGDYIDYMTKTLDIDFIGALDRLSKVSGVEITGYDKEQYQQSKKRADILDRAHTVCQGELFSPDGEDVLEYLLDRGYTEDEIKAMQLGAYNKERLSQELQKDFSDKEIRESKILTLPDEYRLTILWRDVTGRSAGLQGRKISGDDKDKYRYIAGTKRSEAFVGLDKVRRRKDTDIFMVEGALDALYLNYKLKDMEKSFICIGGKSIHNKQVKALKDAGINNIILSLDTDAQADTEKLVRRLIREDFNIRVLSIQDDRYKDLDELVRAEGRAGLEKLKVSHYSSWITDSVWNKYDTADIESLGYIKALHETLRYYKEASGVDRKAFLKNLTDKYSDLSPEDIQEELEKVEDKDKEEQALRDIKALSGKLKKAQDVDTALTILENGLDKATKETSLEVSEPYFLEDFLNDIESSETGLQTGYNELDNVLDVPQDSLTIVGGRPAHGKTSLMLNIFLNMIERYENKSFYFYSFEMNKKSLMVRLLQIMSGYVLDRQHNTKNFYNYIKYRRHGGETKIPAIEDALERYRDYVTSGRLYLVNRPLTDRQLSRDIRKLANKEGKGAVFVDYLQRVSTEADAQARYVEIKKVSDALLQTAIQEELPIIAGAQFRRTNKQGERPTMDSLREGGDMEQDASLILGLYDESKDNNEEVITGDGKREIEVSILKNREGVSGMTRTLLFEGSTYKITE